MTDIQKVFGVLTSGGDAQGMNAIIRSIVRLGIQKKLKIFLIYEGYNGLIKGGDQIKEAKQSTVDHIIHQGGTFIGSSRCNEFRVFEGRVNAALTLIKNNISYLIVIGGDGSLTGANILRTEWNSILETLLQKGQITEEMKIKNNNLNIIGIVGSIDNDFCQTEMTTGADTALHRIVESVDSIATSATSHQRTMIIEVMGRKCGYLALLSALATEATFTFIPESPPPDDWPEILIKKIQYERSNGRRINIIIVCEGAVNQNGEPITSLIVKKTLDEKTKLEVRVSILGHIQRGGKASAFDRILGSRLGAAAVVELEKSNSKTESTVLTLKGNKIIPKSLVVCVEETRQLAIEMTNKNWNKCMELRGSSFQRSFETFRKIHMKDFNDKKSNGKPFAVIQVGEPAPGMNTAVLSFIRILILNDMSVFGVRDGFDGLVSGKGSLMKWSDVTDWTAQSGALLGTTTVPDKMTRKQLSSVAEQLKKLKISGLLIIGGFRAFQLLKHLSDGRKTFRELNIPLCVIPATVHNNVPGTDLSIGSDSALNKITELCTDILVSTRGTGGRVYIVKMDIKYCGYLTVMSAIASGADYCYLFEYDFNEKDVRKDANTIKIKIMKDNSNRLIILNTTANIKIKPKTIDEIYAEEGSGVFNVQLVDLTNLKQTLSPSPFDRIMAIKMGVRCADWFRNSKELTEEQNAVVCGLTEKNYGFNTIAELVKSTDFEHQIHSNQWFINLIKLVNLCSQKHRIQ